MKRLALASILALSIWGCGGSGSNSNGPSGPPGTPVTIQTYLLAADSGGNSLDIFRVSPTGALAPVPTSPVVVNQGLISLEVHPTRPFVYAAGFNNSILGYSMDAATGALTVLPGFPVQSEPENNVIMDRTGNFLYSLGEDGIDGFRIDQTSGALTRLAGFPMRGLVELRNGDFDRNNQYLYVADFGSDQLISYHLNGQTGALTEVSRIAANTDPFAVEMDLTNNFLYVSEADGNLDGFRRNPDGSLSRLANFPINYAPAGAATARFDFQDQFLFIGDRTSRTLNAFSQNPATGQLTRLPGYPSAGGGGDLVVYPFLSFLYTGDRPNRQIPAFRIGNSGATTPVPGSPFSASGGPNELLPVVLTTPL